MVDAAESKTVLPYVPPCITANQLNQISIICRPVLICNRNTFWNATCDPYPNRFVIILDMFISFRHTAVPVWIFKDNNLWNMFSTLQWRHNEGDGVSNHRPHDCLLNRLFKAPIKDSIKAPASLVFARGIHRGPMNSPHKVPVTQKMFPFDDVIMK